MSPTIYFGLELESALAYLELGQPDPDPSSSQTLRFPISQELHDHCRSRADEDEVTENDAREIMVQKTAAAEHIGQTFAENGPTWSPYKDLGDKDYCRY